MGGALPKIALNQNKPTSIIDPVRNPRSVFDLSQAILTTINCDLVYPLFWEEIIPSDTMEINTALGGRAATPLFPLMDNLQIQYDWWFVPHRIVWEHFVNFWGEREIDDDQNVQQSYLVPIIDDTSKEYAAAVSDIATQGFGFNGLASYLLAGNDVGVPMDTSKGNYVTSLLFRSYMKIGYHWYIDQIYGTLFINDANNVEVTGFIPLLYGDGPDDCSQFQLFKKGKKKDYFTSLRPTIMNGDDGGQYLNNVLGAFVPLQNNLTPPLNDDIVRVSNAASWDVYIAASNTKANSQDLFADGTGQITNAAGAQAYSLDPDGGLQLDFTNLGVSINNIRLYEQVQQYYERFSRTGSRYVEYAFGTYGVTPEDSRLQLPEWLGGHTERLQYTPVASTADGTTVPVGDLAAYGTLVSYAPTITKSFSEHGFIMCLATVYPDLTYQQGIDRKLKRRTKYDYHDPLWENLTEQAVLSNELTVADNAQDILTLGYSPRFAEMKQGRRKLSGLMRSSHPQSLDAWHLAQDITPGQTMDATFRTYDTDFARTQAVGSQPALILYGEAKITAARPLQVNPTPIIGGF